MNILNIFQHNENLLGLKLQLGISSQFQSRLQNAGSGIISYLAKAMHVFFLLKAMLERA